MKTRPYIGTAQCVAALLWLTAAKVVAQDLSMEVTASRAQIYLGESVLLTVKVSGDMAAEEPDLTGIADATVRLRDSQAQNYQQVSVVNGIQRVQSFRGRVFTYEVRPQREGAFQAGPVRLARGGRTLSDPGPSVQVQGIEKQERVIVEVLGTRESVLVEEPFEVTVVVRVQRLQGRFAEIDPFLPGDAPHLEIPFVGSSPTDLEGPDFQNLLQQRLVRPRQPGFRINEFTVNSGPFAGFPGFADPFGREAAMFGLDRSPAVRNGLGYFEYRLALRYKPLEEGTHTFGPVIFKGNVVVAADAAGQAVTKPVYAIGPAFTVRVVPPPEEGRPDSYVGALGSNVTVAAELDAQVCNVGDPLRLTLRIEGDITRRSMRPPPLGARPEIARLFRVYDDSVETRDLPRGAEYVYTLRPIQAGTIELPPIEVAFYDTVRRAYRTVASRPVPLQARGITEAGSNLVIARDTNTVAIRAQRRVAALSPAPLRVAVDGRSLLPTRSAIMAWMLIPPAAGALLILAAAAVHALPRLRRARRRASAAHVATEALRTAMPPEGIDGTLLAYLQARLGCTGVSLTPIEAERLLLDRGVPAEPAAALRSVLESAFNRRYGSDESGVVNEAAERMRARDAVQEVEQALRRAESRRDEDDEESDMP